MTEKSGNRNIHLTIDLNDINDADRDTAQEKTPLFQDETSILDKLNLVYKKTEQNFEHGKTSITVIDFEDEEQHKKALRLLTNHYSLILWKVLPVLRNFGLYPRADVRYRTAQAVGDLMCEMNFVRIKDEIVLPWAKHHSLEVNANVGLVVSEVIKRDVFTDNVIKLLKYWNTVSDPNLNRTALVSAVPICADWAEESLGMVHNALSRHSDPWDYSMEATLASFVLRELCSNGKAHWVIDRLAEWINRSEKDPVLKLGAALTFIEVVKLSDAFSYENGKDKIVNIFQVCLENRRIDDQGMIRSETAEKLKGWIEKSFGDDDKEYYLEILFMRLYMRATTQRDKDRIVFYLKRWQRQDKEKRFSYILDRIEKL